MPWFGRGKQKEAVHEQREHGPSQVAAEPPTTDWAVLDNIIEEWRSQLEDPQQAMLGWRNGMHMYESGPIPMQRFNAAEYMTRALAYNLLGQPLLSDADAVTTVRRVLDLLDRIPSEPPWLMEFAPRIARLALAVCRLNGWQPQSLGGDGQVNEEILGARRDGPVWSALRSPGAPDEEVMKHFFLTT